MATHQFKKYLAEVLERIAATAPKIPAQRKAFRQGYSFSKEAFEQQLVIWDFIWKQRSSYRSQLQAFLFLDQHVSKQEHHLMLWKTSASWQHDIDDWGLCDSLSKINTKVLETHPDIVYKELQDWNSHSSLWNRRQSLVSLLYYSRTKKKFLSFDRVSSLIVPLLQDKEYYVQKGLGWTLRELHNVYPGETLRFLHQHAKNISAIAFTIAVEKMSEEREKLKILRKSMR